MDGRNVLTAGTILPFPGMECEIDSVVGCGSNAVVYHGHYQDHQNSRLSHQVLIKELFPYDPEKKIYRNSQGNICVKPEAADIMELHRLSFLRGNEIHIRLLMQHPEEIDTNINTFERNHTLYTILGFSGGRSLDKELLSEKVFSLRQVVHCIREALEVLEAFHGSGYLHLDISPDNILLIGEGKKQRVTLIDYNSVHTLEEIREGKSVYYSAKEGYTAPEIRGGRCREISFCSDLYAMTAVFYTCLTGKRLTAMQSLRSSVPDISGAECLRECPSTVISMVRTILKKGLTVVPGRRYQSAKQMLTDLEELKDRIDGKGITNWALWETGRINVIKAIKENTALSFIREEENIFPLRGTEENGKSVSLLDMDFVYGLEDRKPLLLLGSGGMGKTTVLLRMAYHQKREYTPSESAITYISLFDWQDSGDTYIRDHVLEKLRFKRETDSMETARNELMRLLSEPIQTKKGYRPSLILLLDGLNEASGDIRPLQKEINELTGWNGVQMIITSRSEIAGVSCKRIVLERLNREDVKTELSKYGLLAPENMELLELLHIPMLLSMFIHTALAEEKQLQIDTKEELLDRYFSAMLEKEILRLPESSRERWGMQAAMIYVLPEAAALIRKRGKSVSDTELLKLVGDCYKELTKRPLTAVFPKWIGHGSDIKMGAEDVDEWYGKIILDILWKRMGLIVRDEQGNFRILHQMVEEYLVDRSAAFHKEFDRQKKKSRNWKMLVLSGTITGLIVVLSLTFAMYNAHMLNTISKSNREILKYESQSLSQLSALELENGDARKAAETAIRGLPSAKNERPYVAEAEKALSNAAGIYQYPHYQVTDKIVIESEVTKFEYTENGDFIVIMDDSDVISCIDGKKGNKLWSIQSKEPYEYIEIKAVDKLNAVLLAGPNSSKLVSLVSGEILWEVIYEEIVEAHISNASLLTSNEQLMVLEIVACDDHGSFNFLQYIVLDMQTGSLKSKTGNILEETVYQNYIARSETSRIQSSFGEISENQVCAVVAEVDYYDKVFWMLWFDLESGEILERSIVQTDHSNYSYMLNKEYWTYGYWVEAYSPEGKLLGDFFCLIEKNSVIYVEFFPEKEETLYFSYQELFAFRDERHTVLVHGNTIYGYGYGEKILSISYEREIIHCIEADEHTLFLLFSDGSIQYFNIEDFDKASIRLNDRLIGNSIESVHVYGRKVIKNSDNNEVFFVTNGDTGELLRCEITEDKNSRYFDINAGIFRESTTYITLNRDVLFSMNWNFELNVYQAAVIDVEKGCTVESFTLDQVLYKDECFGISVDQKLLLFQDFLYDWSSGEVISLDQISIEQLKDRKIQLFDESLFYNEERIIRREEFDDSYMPDKLYWLMNGKVHEVSMLSDGVNVLEQKTACKENTGGFTEAPYVSENDFIAGKSGVFLFWCSDEEISQYEGIKVTHYMAYSQDTETWSRIEDISTNKTYVKRPVVAVGDVKKWIAMADTDHIIRLYDLSTNKYLLEYDVGISLSVIKSLQFIMEDQYLAVGTEDHTVIIDVKSGDVVYEQYQDHCSAEPEYWWNNQSQELFVYCTCGTGYCIDTDSWSEKYEIDHLVYASDQAIITNNYSYKFDESGYYDVIAIYPFYSLEEKIQLAEERFGLSEEIK